MPVKISVVIPAFNEERLLAQTIRHVRGAMISFTALHWETELIVCDNNSTDATAQIAREAGAMVVFEPVNQIGRARNRGAAAATGDWLLFIDADSHPSPELLADVADQIQSGRCLAGGVTVRLQGRHHLANFVTGVWNWKSRTRRWLAGSFIFCDATVFRKLNGFSNEHFVAEELDLSWRLHDEVRKTGRELVILHRHPLLTSDRKMRLYTTWELLRFLFRVALRPGSTMRDREACHAWYDGRR